MININVKNIQNGEIISARKEITHVYVTFVKDENANLSINNLDLQSRLNPLASVISDNVHDKEIIRTFENVRLQENLYSNLDVTVPTGSDIKQHEVIEIWAFVDGDIRKIFSLIASCFGSGTWISNEKWIDTELWKY